MLSQAISLMSAHGGTVECYCLMQVLRGAENCSLPCSVDAHNVLRQFRAQSSTSSKAAVEAAGAEGDLSTACFLQICCSMMIVTV